MISDDNLHGFGMLLGVPKCCDMLKHLYIVQCICYMAMKEFLTCFVLQIDFRAHPNPQPFAPRTTSLQGTAPNFRTRSPETHVELAHFKRERTRIKWIQAIWLCFIMALSKFIGRNLSGSFWSVCFLDLLMPWIFEVRTWAHEAARARGSKTRSWRGDDQKQKQSASDFSMPAAPKPLIGWPMQWEQRTSSTRST